MILENNYSHASDVWAFGILAWELYTAYATGQERNVYSIPYCGLDIDEVGIITTSQERVISVRKLFQFKKKI